VGVEKALTMMLRSKSIKACPLPDPAPHLLSQPLQADEALKSGLLDAVVPTAEDVLPAAKALALELAAGKKPRVQSLKRSDRLPNMMVLNFMLTTAREGAEAAAKHMSHPLACIDAVEVGVTRGGEAGIKKEGELFRACVHSPTSKALVHFFFAQRGTASVPGYTDKGLKARPIRRVGVLGGGLMGAGIATACIMNGIDVLLKEVAPQFLEAGLGRVKANVESLAKKRKMSPEAVAAIAWLFGSAGAVAGLGGGTTKYSFSRIAAQPIRRAAHVIHGSHRGGAVVVWNRSPLRVAAIGPGGPGSGPSQAI